MTNPRTRAKIEARIHERVAYCVEFELNDPRSSFITVTGVKISNDLAVARISYSIFGTKGEKSKAAHMLEDASGFVRRQLGRVLNTKRIPHLIWIYDDSAEIQEEVERAITSALNHDREINPGAHPKIEETKPPQATRDEVELEYLDFLNAQEEEEGK